MSAPTAASGTAPDTAPTCRDVSFRVDGLALAGHLWLPAGDGPFPAVALTGPFSAVKEQATGTHAEALAARGIAALAFDHRRWGASEGVPRCHESTADRVADLRGALSFLATQEAVDADRLGVVGVCLGAVAATLFAAYDPRARVLALVGGSYNEPTALRAAFGAEGYDGLLAEFAAIAQREHETGEVEYWPAANPEGMPAGMPGPEPWAYYGTERGARPGWENRCTALSVHEELTTTAVPALPMLAGTPLIVVHGRGDTSCPPADAQRTVDAVAAAGGDAELVWVDADDHVGLYDRPDLVATAADATRGFLTRRLA